MRDSQAVKTSERAIQKITVKINVVVGREQHRIDAVLGHVFADLRHAVGILLQRKSIFNFFAIAQANQVRHVFNHRVAP
jgi:hypothetical protein